MVATTKWPLLSPGAAHDRRAATEGSPESADEIGCASRRGDHSGWRPSMMNEAADVRHRPILISILFCRYVYVGGLDLPISIGQLPHARGMNMGNNNNSGTTGSAAAAAAAVVEQQQLHYYHTAAGKLLIKVLTY